MENSKIPQNFHWRVSQTKLTIKIEALLAMVLYRLLPKLRIIRSPKGSLSGGEWGRVRGRGRRKRKSFLLGEEERKGLGLPFGPFIGFALLKRASQTSPVLIWVLNSLYDYFCASSGIYIWNSGTWRPNSILRLTILEFLIEFRNLRIRNPLPNFRTPLFGAKAQFSPLVSSSLCPPSELMVLHCIYFLIYI